MKISHAPTILAWTPEKTVEATKVDPAIHAGLENCLQDNPSEVLLGRPLGGVGANVRFSLGDPVAVTENVEFLRVFPSNAATELALGLPDAATDLVRAASAAMEAPSPALVINAADMAKAFAEKLPDLPREVNIGLKLYGLLRTGSDLVTTLKQPGSPSNVERNLAFLHLVAAACVLSADLPVPKRVQSGAKCLAWLLQIGERFFIVPHSEDSVTRGL